MDKTENRRHLLLLAIITMIVIYIAVSVYGVIRDIYGNSTVFIISSSLPVVEDYQPAPTILDRLKGIFTKRDQVVVPVVRLVTIKGWVRYTDGIPFAHGLVELRSEPRNTYTDSDGYFTFENVEDGEHVINVLGPGGKVLASAKVSISRNIEVEEAMLVQLEDGTFVLEVAVDVKVLEIFLEIEQDGEGQPTGNLILGPGYEVLEYYPPEEQPTAPPVIDEPDEPEDPEPPVQPEDPELPHPPDLKPEGSGGGSSPKPTAGALTVYSTGVSGNDKYFRQPPQPAAQVNIFGKSKRIAPGMTGSYRFTVDNKENNFGVYYDIKLMETNNTLDIPMKYRLKNNKTKSYVTNDDKWHTPAQISQATANPARPLSMNEASQTDYTLEWFWDDRGQIDNSIGEQHAGDVVCTLTIKVSAQRK